MLPNYNETESAPCCSGSAIPRDTPLPDCLEGCVVLDLDCADASRLAKLVGPEGKVIAAGFQENLAACEIEAGSIDVVVASRAISNAADKHAILAGLFNALKPGGELYLSDIFADRRVPRHLLTDPEVAALACAPYIEDFRRLLRKTGCPDYRVMAKQRLRLDNPIQEVKIGMVDFYAMTVRAFKLACLEDICENFGQSATYLGTIPGHPHAWNLDDHHRLVTGKPMLVCGNTAAMLEETRFGNHFRISGDRSAHFGPFDCSTPPPASGCGC